MNILITSIGRRGYIADYFRETGMVDQIVSTSNTKWTSGFVSCDINYLLPDISNEADYITSLLEICKEHNVGLLFSLFDFDIQILSKNLSRFQDQNVLPLVVNNDISEFCFDKYKSKEFFESVGICHPKTYKSLKESQSDLEKGELSFPLFVKPRFGFASKNIFIAENNDQLQTFFGLYPDMIIQEYLKGEEYSFDLLNDLNSENVMVVCKKKITMRAGETDQAITIKDDNLLSFGKELANKIGHIGPMDVDLFIKDGKPYVLELNPRFGGGYPLSHLAGANFPELIMKMATNQEIDKNVLDFQEDVIMMKSLAFISTFGKNIKSLRND